MYVLADVVVGLRKLVLLNLLASEDESIVASIPTQRLVFLVKHLVQCLQTDAKLRLGLQVEIIKTLTIVFPSLEEIYGSHWEEILDTLSRLWKETGGGDEALPLLAASFRLFSRLRTMAEGDCNDDLKDTWTARKSTLFRQLASVLGRFGMFFAVHDMTFGVWLTESQDSSTAFYQPRDVAVDSLCRLISTAPVQNLENVNDMFPLLTADSGAVQRAAYEILHRYIPGVQEQVSFDVALSKSSVHLPDELMSLLLDVPTVDLNKRDKKWADTRAYLLSWKVAFDHFPNAVRLGS